MNILKLTLIIRLLKVKISWKSAKEWLHENGMKISGFYYEIYREISSWGNTFDPWVPIKGESTTKNLKFSYLIESLASSLMKGDDEKLPPLTNLPFVCVINLLILAGPRPFSRALHPSFSFYSGETTTKTKWVSSLYNYNLP